MRGFVVLCLGVTLFARYAFRVIAATGTALMMVAGLACLALWYRGHDPQADWLVWPAVAVIVSWVADIEFHRARDALVNSWRKRLADGEADRSAVKTMLAKQWR